MPLAEHKTEHHISTIHDFDFLLLMNPIHKILKSTERDKPESTMSCPRMCDTDMTSVSS